jgi:cytochrome b
VVRLFHWSLVACVLANLLLLEEAIRRTAGPAISRWA